MEADARSRYVDYSCTTDWEFLVNDLEGLLRKWGLQNSAIATPREVTVQYLGEALKARVVVHPGQVQQQPAGAGAFHMLLSEDEDAEQLSRCWDLGSRADGVCRLFGLRACLALECRPEASPFWTSTASAQRDQVLASSVLSALVVAAANFQSGLPCAVVASDGKSVTGFAATPRQLLRLQCESRNDIGPPFRRLNGLLELFRAKLGCSSPGRAFDVAPGTDAHVRVSVRHTWEWERPWDRARKTRWRTWHEEQARKRAQRDGRGRRRRRLSELSARLPHDSWGASLDPLQRFHVAVCWPNAREGVFTESPTGSSLRPLEARPRAWSLRCEWARGEASARLSQRLRRLLAAYVHAQCLRRDTVFADLSFREAEDTGNAAAEAKAVAAVLSDASCALVDGMRTTPDAMTSDAKEALRRTVANVFMTPDASSVDPLSTFEEEEEGEDKEEKEQEKYQPERECVGAAAAAQVEQADNSLLSTHKTPASPQDDGRSLWLWLPNSAPVGRLVSLLAGMLSEQDNLQAMAVSWVEACAQIRRCWDGATRLPHMAPDPVVDGPVAPRANQTPAPEPDLRLCLLMQKLQMLDLCISLQQQQQQQQQQQHNRPRAPEELPHSPPSPSRGPEGCASDGDEIFFDVVEEEKSHLLQVPTEPLRAPDLLVACPLTSDMIRQRQLLLSQMHAGDDMFAQVHQQLRLAHLRSAMQSFKAANPGGVFADFVRWFAPGCWDVNVDANVQPDEAVATDVRLVWPGQGVVRVQAAHDASQTIHAQLPDEPHQRVVQAEWVSLWTSTSPVSAADQKPLFHVPQEAEKVLHFLETLPPVTLLSQLLIAALSNAHFLLAEAPTLASSDLPVVRATIDALGRLAGQAVAAVRDSEDFDGLTADKLGTAAVSQSALLACDRFCDAVEDAELLLSRAASLMHKLPGRTLLVETILSASSLADGGGSDGFVVMVDDVADREALLRCFSGAATNDLGQLADSAEDLVDGLLDGESAASRDETGNEARRTDGDAGLTGPSKREYLFRCTVKAPVFERASKDAATALPVRMYACVDGHRDRDPVRLALAISQSPATATAAEN